MGARGVERAVIGVALTLLAACGGTFTRNPGEEDGGGTGGTGISPSGGSTAGSGSTAGAAGTPSWLVELSMDDKFPWFIQEPGSAFTTSVMAQDGVLTFELEGAPLQRTISTHNHLAVVPVAQGVTFRGRASRNVALRVSVASVLGTDYFQARDTGNEWPSAPTPLTTEWATFEVALAEMRPAEVTAPNATPAFTFAFIVDEPSGPVEIWLDDVHFY